MGLLTRLNDLLFKLTQRICVFLLGWFIVVVLLQIMARNVFKVPMTWTDEVALFSFLWSVFLGSALALRLKTHYVVELFPARLIRINLVLDLVADLAILVVIYILIVGGIGFTWMGQHRLAVSVPVSLAWFFVAMPISGILMTFFGLENIVKDVRKIRSWLESAAGREA